MSQQLIIYEKPGYTKIQSLLESINEAVSSGVYQPGDVLPSVNELSRLSGFSRDTVVKAYKILKQQSVIESAPAKGYFVSGKTFRIFMLLDDFSAFKEQLYRSFRENLPNNYSVDLLFHHYNAKIFEQLIRNALGRYNIYIVMNINNRQLHPILSKIDPNKLLVLDMGCPSNDKANLLLQSFDTTVAQSLEENLHLFGKYDEFILIYSKQKTPHPPETVKVAEDFCAKHHIALQIFPEFRKDYLRKRQVYLVIAESDLVQVFKACGAQNLHVGSDVGIIAYNDTPMKEIAGGGITVISVDFREMGKKAAQFVRNKQKIREMLPAKLIVRNSL